MTTDTSARDPSRVRQIARGQSLVGEQDVSLVEIMSDLSELALEGKPLHDWTNERPALEPKLFAQDSLELSDRSSAAIDQETQEGIDAARWPGSSGCEDSSAADLVNDGASSLARGDAARDSRRPGRARCSSPQATRPAPRASENS